MAKPKAAPSNGALVVERVEIDKLVPAPYNPRIELKPGDPEWDKLARSIDEFGTVELLVWNKRTGHVVGGHQRLAILKHRGDTHVSVSVVDLPPEREKALNLALNRLDGRWDNTKVLSVISELGDLDPTLIEVTGFEPGEIAALAGELERQLFEPVMPTLEANLVVEHGAVASAAASEKRRFIKPTEVRDITCPNCGKVFGLGGQLGELAAKTPGLQVSEPKPA